MTTFDQNLRAPVAAALATILLIAVGCGGDVPKDDGGPSYADLVVTYNAELAALDRLEQKKQALLQKMAAIGRPTSEDALKLLSKVLDSGQTSSADDVANDAADPNAPLNLDKVLDSGQASNEDPVNDAADPNAALDLAVQRALETQNATRGLLESISKEPTITPEQTAQNQQIKNALSRELEALEREIATQRQRVQRARQARDAAEAVSR